MDKINFKKIIPYLAALGIFALLSIVYFAPQLQGKVISQGDLVSNKEMGHEVRKYKSETGIHSMWTNSMFGGMPVYQIAGAQKNNVSRYVEDILMLGFSKPIGYFIYAMLSFFILLISLGVNPWLAILMSVAFGFTTNNLILYEAGHATKLKAVFASPIIIAGVVHVYRSNWLTGGVLFLIGMSLGVYANHVQMTYYLALVLIIYTLMMFVEAWKKSELRNFFIGSAILTLGLIIAMGTGAANLMTTYEYSKDTMRGDPILEVDAGHANSSSQVSGLDWNYAMQWSNGVIDLFSSYIPMAAGGGSGYKLNKDSATAKDLRRKGANTRNGIRAPMYFGDLPSTSGPPYFGAVIFLLFIIGLITYPGKLKWWIGISVLFYFLLSMGKHSALINRTLFDLFPLFNKFRTPNSVLTVAAVFMPLLAALSLNDILGRKDTEKLKKGLMWATGVLSVIALYFAFGAPATFSFEGASDSAYAQRGFNIDALISDRAALLRQSALRTLAIVLISAGAIYLWLNQKINQWVFIGIVAVVTLFDVLGVGSKYLSKDDFISPRSYDQAFKPRPVDSQILQDPDLHYRVHDLSIDPFNSSSSSYHHKTIGGYHPAKLQRYQDIIDRHVIRGNQKVLDMLNMKYIIVPDQQTGNVIAQRNPSALGNAWFVNSVKFVDSPNAEIDGLNAFDPNLEAIVHTEYKSGLKDSYTKTGKIELVSYSPNKLVYQSSSDADQLAIFSEVWYGPNKGWKATIDGKEQEHIRANYILRGLEIPAGSHEIVFEFDPSSYKTGELISLISSILLLLCLGYFLYKNLVEKKNSSDQI